VDTVSERAVQDGQSRFEGADSEKL